MDVFDSFATHTYRSRYWAYSHPTGLFKAPLLGEFKSFSHGCASFLLSRSNFAISRTRNIGGNLGFLESNRLSLKLAGLIDTLLSTMSLASF